MTFYYGNFQRYRRVKQNSIMKQHEPIAQLLVAIFQPPPNFFPRIFLPFLKKITNPYSYPSDCFLTFGLSQDSNKFCTLRLIWYVILSLLIYEFTCFSLCHLFVNKSRLFVIWNCPHAEFKKIDFTYFLLPVWVFLLCGLFLQSWGYCSLWRMGFSLWRLLLLQNVDSRAHGLQQLQHRGSVVHMFCGTWDPPGAGVIGRWILYHLIHQGSPTF